MSGEASGPGWDSERPWEHDRQPCGKLAGNGEADEPGH